MSSVVPEQWDFCPIGNHIEVLTDYTANGSFASLKENVQYFNEKNYAALVRTTDLAKDTFCPQRFTDKKGYEFLKKSSLTHGDIVIANVGSAGKAYRVPDANMPMTLAPNMYLVKFCKSMDNDFAFQVITYEKFYSDLMSNVGSSTLNAINKSNFRSINIFVPPLPEQKKIASILTSVDEVIENTQKQIDKLQDLKKATMNELLTKGIGHTEFKDSELGRIPKSWEVIAIAELLELKNGLNTNADAFGSGSPFLSYKDIYKDTELTERSFSQKVEVSERENNSFSVNYGDVFFTRTSETPEEIGFANVYLGENVGAVFNGFCIRGRPVTNKLSVRLSRFLFRSAYVRVQMRFLCKYTTRAGISGESLNRCLLAVPPIDEQEKYLKTLNSIEKMIETAGKKRSQTQFLKKSLMQDLLTGKVRVTVN